MVTKRVDIIIDAKNRSKNGFRSARKGADRLSKSITGLSGVAARAAGALGAVLGAAALFRLGKQAVQLAGEQQEAEAKLAAVLKSTGQAAGFSAEQLKKRAGVLQDLTAQSDQEIINTQAILATFTQVQGEVFDRAINSTLDLSAVMGQDLRSSVVQVGKALNDPIRGVTALQRVGITLNDQQRDQIKTFQDSGKIMQAQKVILDELETQFGGTAQAMAKTVKGDYEQLFNQMGDFAEVAGERIANALPLERITGVFREANKFLNSNPETPGQKRKRIRAENLSTQGAARSRGVSTVDQRVSEKALAAAQGALLAQINEVQTDITTRAVSELTKKLNKQQDAASKQAALQSNLLEQRRAELLQLLETARATSRRAEELGRLGEAGSGNIDKSIAQLQAQLSDVDQAIIETSRLELAQRQKVAEAAQAVRDRELEDAQKLAKAVADEAAAAEREQAERTQRIADADAVLAQSKINALQAEVDLGNEAARAELERLRIVEDFKRQRLELVKIAQDEAVGAERRAQAEKQLSRLAELKDRALAGVGGEDSEGVGGGLSRGGVAAFEVSRRFQGFASRQTGRDREQRIEQNTKKTAQDTKEAVNILTVISETLKQQRDNAIKILGFG